VLSKCPENAPIDQKG